jgi:sugar phosphate isomerase/epimerase
VKPIPISVQLYSVREAAAKDFAGVLARIAEMGYVGVEFAGLHGKKPAEVRKMMDSVGLVASSTHGPFPTKENAKEIIETAKTLGYTRHISGFGDKDCATKEAILAAAARAREAAELLKPAGIAFGLHNHWWEFDKLIEGKTPHEIIMANAPEVFAQVDTYWVAVGGRDAASVVKKLGARAPTLHIKDGPLDKKEPMTAVGEGRMDWQAVIGAAHPSTEWLVVELDRCATDMFEAVKASLVYLTSRGFARGRK